MGYGSRSVKGVLRMMPRFTYPGRGKNEEGTGAARGYDDVRDQGVKSRAQGYDSRPVTKGINFDVSEK